MINDYKDGCAAFCAIPEEVMEQDEDGVIARTYGGPMKVLENWDRTVLTRDGAVAALRLIRDEKIYIDGFGASVFLAALGFLEQEA